MAKQYTLTSAFTPIEESSGIIYNAGSADVELASDTNQKEGQGLILRSGCAQEFSGKVYARARYTVYNGTTMETATVNVVDFSRKVKGGGSGSTTSQVTEKTVALATGVTCKKGTLLGYKAGGYVLADNKDATTLTGVALAMEGSSNGSVKVLLRGDYAVDGLADGSSVYVGTSGAMTTTVPTTSGQYIKCVGVVHGNILDFAPSEIAVQIA